MPSSNQFNGLQMPVFTAFGWAGEEKAIEFALSQLEIFIDALYFYLHRDIQAQFPFHGLDKASQSVYLSSTENPDDGLFIAFNARPMSLELRIGMTNKDALAKAYKSLEASPTAFYQIVTDLGQDWTLHLQQMEYDEENGTASNYQDIYKDSVMKLSLDSTAEYLSRAAFLNSESQWLVPFYLSERIDSEKASAMGPAIVKVMSERITALMPLIKMLTGKTRRAKPKAKSASKARAKNAAPVEQTTIRQPSEAADLERFTYISELKPLHIKKGFVNLTSNHWPFFAINARTEIRDVSVKYEDKINKKSSVWRLVPNDQARIVLAPPVQEWLEENFGSDDKIQVTAIKLNDKDIQITLDHAE
ncbi:MAG: hypothetical protein GWO38_12935 [Phycisphaerae bacterium]|nr:hypothetical protein [Phycisphaerae bacterium]NIX28503.1 hypothetical protein [Phycisphaerae bacterium]